MEVKRKVQQLGYLAEGLYKRSRLVQMGYIPPAMKSPAWKE